ncbi:MAG TPA: GntG family PLP-dependent aldolase [Puia sp.]|jgi:threonine aldolase|nr:GntG family PLP-dependent aldolase [Puia sp.]
MIIDFRSDTVTKPTPAMMHAMMHASVGDDVFGEDPSINQLEEMAARLFNMEAALFCPTGTMSNQIAIRCHTHPGDEVICSNNAHVYIYEGGGIAANSGSQVRAIPGNYGRITGQQVLAAINPDDVHKARTRLVCLENTANRGGGSCYDLEEIRKIRQICNENSLQMHLDGARLFNALVAKKETASQYGEIFDSISVCLSKGLGCPIGSVLLGSKRFMTKARRVRKVFGGSMRQAGFMAAAGIYALQNNIERLSQDHLHAKLISEALMKKDFVKDIMPVETNIVIATMKEKYPAKQIAEILYQKGVHVIAIAPHELRFVTHLDISESMVEKAIQIIEAL